MLGSWVADEGEIITPYLNQVVYELLANEYPGEKVEGREIHVKIKNLSKEEST